MAWQTAFKRLSDDERVLGWVAFHDERVGASDRSYDQDFLEALRQHRRATEKLRRHVGLSQVTETAVVGEEGKVWFLTVMDDAWFALFIDKDVDGVRLANELLDPVQTVLVSRFTVGRLTRQLSYRFPATRTVKREPVAGGFRIDRYIRDGFVTHDDFVRR